MSHRRVSGKMESLNRNKEMDMWNWFNGGERREEILHYIRVLFCFLRQC